MRIRFDTNAGTLSYEIEGTEEEIINLREDTVKALYEKLTALGTGFAGTTTEPTRVPSTRPQVHVSEADLLAGWIEKVDNRPHLTSLARNLTLKDLIIVALYAHKFVLGKDALTPRALYEFLRDDGFPVSYNSILARISELTRGAMLIRHEPEGYKLSRAAEDRVFQIMKGEGGAP